MSRTTPWTIACAAMSAIFINTALAGPGGTTITAEKTAEITQTYGWTLEKTTTPGQVPSFTVPPGPGTPVNFTITATRTGPTFSNVTGQVCVTNTGGLATTGLQIQDRLEVWDGANWIPVTVWTNLPMSNLTPGVTDCVAYSFSVANFNPQLQYRNLAFVSITNFAGFEGTVHGFYIDAAVSVTVIGATATLTDSIVCPTGFTCAFASPTPSFPLVLTGSTSVPVVVLITNNGSPETCGNYTLRNNSELRPTGTVTVLTASASVAIYSGVDCEQEVVGCTRTPGYWASHDGTGSPNQADEVSSKLPISIGVPSGAKSFVVDNDAIVFSNPPAGPQGDITESGALLGHYGHTLANGFANAQDASNGINKLYRDLMAALLNQANGTTVPAAVQATINNAQAFLATHDTSNWAGLTGSEAADVNTWHEDLDNYNNGLSGVPHCQ